MASLYQFCKILIDFEYMNNIYSIMSEPYNTLSELKEKIIKRIFPSPKNLHCFYKNIDLYEQEDNQLYSLFPFKQKLKIRLKKPSKEKRIIKPYKSYKNIYPNSKLFLAENKEIQSKIEFVSELSPKLQNKISFNNNNLESNFNNKMIKKRLLSFCSLIGKTKDKKKSKDTFEINEDEYSKNDELFYYLHKNKIKQYKNLNNDKINDFKNDDIDNFSEKSSILNTEGKVRKKANKLSFDIQGKKKEINNLNSNDKFKIQIGKEERDFEETHEIENNEDIKINDFKSSYFNRINNKDEDKKLFNNNDEKNANPDENYNCFSCKKNSICSYCLNCNKFLCKNCLEKCKLDNHKNIEIKINEDCLHNINLYASLIISNIDKEINQIKEYDHELIVYDIKKKRDNIISMFNEIINLYSQIIKILSITYKEKDIKNAMSKYKIYSNNIKEEINEIIHKAESYLKSEQNNNKPKFKLMNIKYFFDMINEKKNNHKSLTEKMNVYSLNSNININIEKIFNDMEEKMKSITNEKNPFQLNNYLKEEYDKLIKTHENLIFIKDKKKTLLKRRTVASINLNKIHIPNLPSISSPEKNNDKSFNSNLSKGNK